MQLQDLEKVVKKIMTLAGCATRMAREAESMKKLVAEMIRGIDVLRQSHPQLSLAVEDLTEEETSAADIQEEDWECEGAEGLVANKPLLITIPGGNTGMRDSVLNVPFGLPGLQSSGRPSKLSKTNDNFYYMI